MNTAQTKTCKDTENKTICDTKLSAEKELPAYKRDQRINEMLVKGIRWRVEPNTGIRSMSNVEYDVDEHGTIHRVTPKRGRKK